MLEVRDRVADTLVQTFSFRLNKIPEPIPLLGARHKSSVMPNGEYCRSSGLAMVVENFDFELRCDIVHFDVQYVPNGADAVVKRNEGPRFNGDVTDMIQKAKPGDKYFFYNIAYRCGCDPMIRYLSEELNFTIK